MSECKGKKHWLGKLLPRDHIEGLRFQQYAIQQHKPLEDPQRMFGSFLSIVPSYVCAYVC